MATPIQDLRGITDAMIAGFKKEGISNSDSLIEAIAMPAGRKQWADKLGVSTKDILELANRADLARIKGIGGVFGDLLEMAGVDTVKELAHRRPDNLLAKMVEINGEKNLSGRNPALKDCESWVSQAKALGGKITY